MRGLLTLTGAVVARLRQRGTVRRPAAFQVGPARLRLACMLLCLALPASAQQVENRNAPMADLSVMFFAERATPTFGVAHLDAEKLDFSVDSLRHVDDWLETIRTGPGLEADRNRVVLRAGAYVGEVIRRHDPERAWQWVDLDAARQLDPGFFDGMPKVMATAVMLYSEQAGFAFPLAKVEKFLDNGREDSVWFFAEAARAPRD